MSPDARYIPARDVDAKRVTVYPYPAAVVLPSVEEMLPKQEDEEPLGAEYSEPPEERLKRLESVEKIIEQKLAEADRLVAEKTAKAEQNALEVRQKAYEEGYAAGELDGRTYSESQFKVSIGRLEDSLVALSNAVSLLKAASEEEALALISVMAEYLAARQLEALPDAATPLLRSILEAHPFPLPESAAPGEPAALVFMHPKDLEYAQETISAEYPGIRLVADTDLSRGSLKLETADTVLDATYERRRERLLQMITRLKEEGRI